jgi:hypothetical protein
LSFCVAQLCRFEYDDDDDDDEESVLPTARRDLAR